MKRICIYTKDVQLITGKGERQSRELIRKIRKFKNKPKHHPLTIYELCEYLGFEIEKIQPLLR